ncbi:UNVERIFIED_CONTAM: hypothetical protein FKN15_078146 [Acipenser sinensis]
MNTRCPLKRVPSADHFFSHCGLTVQPKSYGVGGQGSSLVSLQASPQAPSQTTGVAGAWLQIEESSKPVRLSQQLEKAVTTNYKPVANHIYNVEYDKKKKEEGKRARADKQQVLDMLFSAFEKHQYYNIKDLVDITKQPVVSVNVVL